MLEVTKASLPGLEGSNWDGILGLLPSSISGSDLFISELYKEGKLKRNAFGISYTDTKSDSHITFGGFDKKIVKEEDDFSFVPLHDQQHWSGELHSIRLGMFDEIETEATSAILDSGTSLILMPTPTFDNFKTLISKDRKCGTLSVYYGCM